MSQSESQRCGWCQGSELYQHYHDTEWGIPCFDERELFEMLNLEGAQAGLSWITILNKREGYRRVFAHFDAQKIAKFTPAKIDKLVQDASIVRHRQKIEAFVNNAKIVVAMQQQGESLVDFLWSFTDFRVIQHNPKQLSDVAASTPESIAMSKALKKRGFKFLGPTTCYAFMQACGMVNDHLLSCPSHAVVKQLAQQGRPAHWP